jgi:hypothetical protein
VGGPGEDRRGGALLDDASQVHDRHLVGHVAHHGKVVADEEVSEVVALLQVHHEVQHLGLDRDVEGRDRLVGHDQLRAGDQRPGDGDALALAAGKLVGVLVAVVRLQSHLAQGFVDPPAPLGPSVPLDQGGQGLGDDARHLVPGVEGAVGVLEHHLEVAPQGLELGRGEIEETGALEPHAALGGPLQGHDRPRQGRLAAAGLADDAEAAPGLDREADPVQGPKRRRRPQQAAARQGIVAHQAVDLQERCLAGHGRPSARSWIG